MAPNHTSQDQFPRPHRCNDRLEDFVQAIFEDNRRKHIPATLRLFWRCMRSKPGEEPQEPFYFLDIKPPGKSPSYSETDQEETWHA
eukprot:c14087_g1_i1 orf=91-348(+)